MMKVMLIAYFSALVILGLLGTNEAVSENASFTHDDRIRCINEIHWSTQQCRESVVIAFKDEILVRSNCSLNGGFLTFEKAFCNESEIHILNELLCTDNATFLDCSSWHAFIKTTTTTSAEDAASAESTTILLTHANTLPESQYLENLKNVLKDSSLSSTCKESVLNETMNTNSSWCLNSDTIDSLNCSKSESDEVYNRICSATTTHVPTVAITTTTKLPLRMLINDTMREKILSFVDHNISSTCRWSVGGRIPRQLTDTRRVCKMFRQSGQNLVANRICTTDEVIKLTAIFCELNFKAGLRKIADTEDGRKDQALDIMANEITTKCHGIMWPQVQIFTGSLSKGCSLLQQAASVLVASGICTQTDIDMLQPIVCYVQPVDPSVLQFQTKLSQLLNSMDEGCNATMRPEMANATNEIEACHLWSKIQDEPRNGTICSDKDNSLFSSTYCSKGASNSNSISYSQTSMLVFFLLSLFPHFYKSVT